MIVYLYYMADGMTYIPSISSYDILFLFLKMFAAMAEAHCDIPPLEIAFLTSGTFRTSISSQPYTIHCDYGRSTPRLISEMQSREISNNLMK